MFRFISAGLPALSISIEFLPLLCLAAALPLPPICVSVCVCVFVLFSHHFELFVVVISRCVADAPHHQLGLRCYCKSYSATDNIGAEVEKIKNR